MPKAWVLTRQAESALAVIAAWTVETFGRRQAAAYGDDLIEGRQALADGTAPSRGCRQLVAADLPEDLRHARVGQHYVLFLGVEERMVVVGFLHVRMNIPARLAALGEPEA